MRISSKSSTRLRSWLAVVLLCSCSEAFCRDSRRPLAFHKSASQPSLHQHDRILSSTALEQASIAPPLEESRGFSVLENIRSRLPHFRAGGLQQKEGSFLERHPFLSAVIITTINSFAADLLTQVVFEASDWNRKRSLLFGAFGFIYQGCAQYAIVNWGWERLFPGTKPRNVVAKICGMNLLSDPILFMPTFYVFREFLLQGTLSWAVIKAALVGYQANALMDWRNSWMVWFPGHAVTYGVMPAHKRIPWMAFLSFFYMCILSLTRGA
jgi:hypothetical protein